MRTAASIPGSDGHFDFGMKLARKTVTRHVVRRWGFAKANLAMARVRPMTTCFAGQWRFVLPGPWCAYVCFTPFRMLSCFFRTYSIFVAGATRPPAIRSGPASPHMHRLKASGGKICSFVTAGLGPAAHDFSGRAKPGHDGENKASSWKKYSLPTAYVDAYADEAGHDGSERFGMVVHTAIHDLFLRWMGGYSYNAVAHQPEDYRVRISV